MSNVFDALDKHKYGVMAVMAVLIGIFIYLQMDSFRKLTTITPFHQGAKVEIPPEEIRLQPENIMLPPDFNFEDVKNIVRNTNDGRERSYDDYRQNSSSSQSIADAEQAVYDLEQEMKNETGGEKARESIRAELELRKERLREERNKPTNTSNNQETSNVTYAGNVMVDFSVPQHTAHQNNDWYVRNPGYTCPTGSSGTVMILVKVSQAGTVTSASYDPSQSSGANSCMIAQAKKYAKISRFNYDNSAASSQTGWIRYIFVSQ